MHLSEHNVLGGKLVSNWEEIEKKGEKLFSEISVEMLT